MLPVTTCRPHLSQEYRPQRVGIGERTELPAPCVQYGRGRRADRAPKARGGDRVCSKLNYLSPRMFVRFPPPACIAFHTRNGVAGMGTSATP